VVDGKHMHMYMITIM